MSTNPRLAKCKSNPPPTASIEMPLDSSELDLPSKPGVYIFRRSDGRARYIGKASDLRSRVRSYFSKSPDREMVPKLIEEADKDDIIVTQSPSDALILEREMIR